MDNNTGCSVFCFGSGYAIRAWLPTTFDAYRRIVDLAALQKVANFSLHLKLHNNMLTIEIPESEQLPFALKDVLARDLALTIKWTLEVRTQVVHASKLCAYIR